MFGRKPSVERGVAEPAPAMPAPSSIEEAMREAAEKEREKEMERERERGWEREKEMEKEREKGREKVISTPTPTPSPLEEFTTMMASFDSMVSTSSTSISALSARSISLLNLQRSLSSASSFASSSLLSAESAQVKAAEDENYDLAEELQAEIEKHATDVERLGRELLDVEVRRKKCRGEREELEAEIVSKLDATRRDLDVFEKTLELEEDKSAAAGGEGEGEGKGKGKGGGGGGGIPAAPLAASIAANQTRLTLDERHILKDEGAVAEEKVELQSTIEQQTLEVEVSEVFVSFRLGL